MSTSSIFKSGLMFAIFAAATGPALAVDFVTTQGSNEWRASVLTGTSVKSKAGEVIGNVNDVVFTQDGTVTAVIVGVGGFLGVGEKNVAVAFKDLSVKTEDGKRVAELDVTKEQLQAAPIFSGEKTTFEKVQDGAQSLASKAKDKAIEMKDAVTKPAESTVPTPTTPSGSGTVN